MQVECTGNSSIEKKQTQKNRRLSSFSRNPHYLRVFHGVYVIILKISTRKWNSLCFDVRWNFDYRKGTFRSNRGLSPRFPISGIFHEHVDPSRDAFSKEIIFLQRGSPSNKGLSHTPQTKRPIWNWLRQRDELCLSFLFLFTPFLI